MHRRNVIFRQRARIRSWIRQNFVTLVKRLRDLQRAPRRITEAAVRFTLQACQVEQQRRKLRGRFAFFSGDAGFAQTFVANLLRAFDVPQALGFRVFVRGFLFLGK